MKKFSGIIALFLLCISVGCSSDTSTSSDKTIPNESTTFCFDEIPEYSGNPVFEVNSNNPFFTQNELTTSSYEQYNDLDNLGRVTGAMACLSKETMPADGEKRGEIGQIKPSGWVTQKYDCINGMYIYNRCHLIAWCLGAENSNEKNLCTGTRYMNVDGMLPYEEMTATYLKNNPQNHVLYRVTPIYANSTDLVCSGVLMEAISCEDEGAGIKFCVYCYNVQPGITINYQTGENSYNGIFLDKTASSVIYTEETTDNSSVNSNSTEKNYILNENTKKFHKPNCPNVKKISSKNKQEYTGSSSTLIEQGYESAKCCNP